MKHVDIYLENAGKSVKKKEGWYGYVLAYQGTQLYTREGFRKTEDTRNERDVRMLLEALSRCKPGIEEIRGFLREWQKVLKSRLTWKDRDLARTSKIKREQNIEELKAKRNTRVLKGLEEDFLEAEAAGWN